MASTATSLDLPDVPLDVVEFASDQHVLAHLRPLLINTRTVFPTAPLSLRLEDDPDFADYRTIRIEVDVTGMGVDEIVAGHNRWGQLLFQSCPAHDVWLFRLGLVQTA